MSYEGLVQGVGFRWTCISIAEGFVVTGWVRNERDGTVTLEAQGASEELVRLSEAIARRFASNLTGSTSTPLELAPSESGFEIKR